MKKIDSIRTIGVAEGGIMGPDIAQVFIQNGYDVILHDLTDGILRRVMDRIHLNQKSLIKRDLLSEDGTERARNRLAPQRGFFHPMGCTCNELDRPVIDSANPEIKLFGTISTSIVPSLEDPVLLGVNMPWKWLPTPGTLPVFPCST